MKNINYNFKKNSKIILLFIILIICYIYYIINYENKSEYNLTINDGDNVYLISKSLSENNIIYSDLLLRVILNYNKQDDKILAGVYNIPPHKNIFEIAKIITNRRNAKPVFTVTIPEGFDNNKIAERLSQIINTYNSNNNSNINFNKDLFLSISKDYQGYLFPETYYWNDNIDERGIILKMTGQFANRVGQIDYKDIVLASIIEGEAKYPEDMKIIAGILKKRMKIGMRLQVDVATNTYKDIGLPSYPINNPGLNAINAVRSPIESKYLYYLTGRDGKMYYSIDYDGHIRNINKYLR